MVFNLDVPTRYWRCPSCPAVAVTKRADAHTEFHDCLALGGLNVPLVEVNDLDDQPRARQLKVQSESGYEVASIRTERMDGSNDVTVFPRAAAAEGTGNRR